MKKPSGQMTVDDYRLPEVEVRLCLREKQAVYSQIPISDPQAAVAIMQEIMHDLDREMLCVVNLDTALRPVSYNVVSIGSIDMSIAPIPNIFKNAILSNAASILLLHNHPSGNIIPSAEDIEVTKKTILAAQLMGIPLVDHLIIGTDTEKAFSIREYDPGLFELRGLSLPWNREVTREQAIAEPVQAYRLAAAADRKPPDKEGGSQMPETDGWAQQAQLQQSPEKGNPQERVDKVKEITDQLEAGMQLRPVLSSMLCFGEACSPHPASPLQLS